MFHRLASALAPHIGGTLLAALAIAASATAPMAATSPLGFAPPDLDYASTCAKRSTALPPLDRDWTQWHGEEVDVPADTLFALAAEYLRGSDRLPRNVATGMALLDYLDARKAVSHARIERLVGKTTIAAATGPADLKAGEAALLSAFNAGLVATASDLAKLYGATGPSTLRDPAKARQFTRAAAAAGDADGQLAYARILAADPGATPATRDLATSTALLSMIQAVASGDCHFMPVIGDLYLRGDLVPTNIDLAISWYEQYAETGDARTAERLGNLLVSRFVVRADSARSMRYLEAAALAGRPAAALTVGIAYASGTTLAQDPVAAEKFLTIAATGQSAEAEQWLARLYAGEFGGAPRPDLARQHFEAALSRAPTPDLEASFGQFLAQSGTPEDAARAATLLRHAATGGIGQAAVLAARIAGGAGAPAADAATWFRLGAALGKPEAARQMARMAACEIGNASLSGRAADWQDRALYLGSTTAMFNAARDRLASTDAAVKSAGLVLMKQAAYKGMPAALAYLVARLETGRDGLAPEPAVAAQMERYIGAQADPDLRLEGQLALIAERLHLATTDAERQAQFTALDALVATAAPAAAELKADILHDTPGADPAMITALYATAAQSGEKRAMRDYAQALQNNPVTAGEARAWVEKAAAAGDIKSRISLIALTTPTAMADLDAIADAGLACSSDERLALARAYGSLSDATARAKAQQWLEASAAVADNDGDALFKLGTAYRDGVGGPDNVALAEDFFNRAAKAGRADGLREVANGQLLGIWSNSSPDAAKAALDSLLKSGDPGAGDMLVRALVAGQVTASLDEVESLLKDAPVTGKTGDTYMKLIQLDEAGRFGGAHADRQATWLEKAANAGNTQAMMRLYRAYAAGIGVAASPVTAAQWLVKAAEGGDARAAGELAGAYDVGFGVPIDPVKAAYWRDRAAPQS